MARRTLIINGLLVVAIVVVAVLGYSWLHTSSKASAARQTTTVRQGTVTSTVSASGNVSSAVNIGVSFNGCSGTLTSIDVAPGQLVKNGQTLATVTTTSAETALATAKTALAQAQASQADTLTSDQQSVNNAVESRSTDSQQANASVESAQQNYDNDKAAKPPASAATLQKDLASISSAELQRTSTEQKDDQQVDQDETKLSQDRAGTSQGAAAVTTAQTNLTTAETDLGACTLTSPMAGTVITVNGTVGATPGSGSVASGSSSSSSTSGSSTSTGSTSSSSSSGSGSGTGSSTSTASSTSGVSTSSGFITMSDMTKLVLPSTVTESDIGSIKVGQSAAVLFAALTDANDPNGTTVTGSVSEVDLASTVSSGVVSYGITISLTNPPANVRLGQSGTATITTASKPGVLEVSSNAITTVGPLKTVTVAQGSSTQVVRVTTGLTGNGMTEVDSGVTAGETVVLPSTSTTSTSTLLGGGGGAGAGGLLGGGR